MLHKMNLKKSVLNAGMLISCIVSFIILIRVFVMFGYSHKMEGVDILSVSMLPLAMSGYIPFACIFAVLPYAFSYLEERNSGYINSILVRTGKKQYIINKIFFTGLSGGLAISIPFLIIFLYSGIIGTSVTPEVYPEIYLEHIWGKYMFIWGGRFVLLCRVILIFLYGCIWAECALLISTLWSNRYIVFLSPFIIYQIMWMTFQNGLFVYLNPVILFRSDFSAETPLYVPFAIQMTILMILSIITYFMLNKKIKIV